MWRRDWSYALLLEPQTSSFNMINKSVKDFLANIVYINTYWIKKLASWHWGSVYVAKDRNDQADTYKAAFRVHCKGKKYISVEKEVLCNIPIYFLALQVWQKHYISTEVSHITLTLNKTQINRRYMGI